MARSRDRKSGRSVSKVWSIASETRKDYIVMSSREQARKYYQDHKEQKRNYGKRYYIKLRGDVIHLLGSKCQDCGNNDIRVLQVDHVSGGGSKEHRELGWVRIMRKIRNGQTDGYQLLCANCNWIKRWEMKENSRGA